LANDQDPMLELIESLPEGLQKEVYKKVVTQLFSENSGDSLMFDEQFMTELVNMMDQDGSTIDK
jgi:hypothetical protein